MRDHAIHDFDQRCGRPEAGEAFEFFERRNAAWHVFESRFIGAVVRDVSNRRTASGTFLDDLRKAFDGDFFVCSDVYDFTDAVVICQQANQ